MTFPYRSPDYDPPDPLSYPRRYTRPKRETTFLEVSRLNQPAPHRVHCGECEHGCLGRCAFIERIDRQYNSLMTASQRWALAGTLIFIAGTMGYWFWRLNGG